MKKEIKYFPIINRSDSCKVKVSDICYITRDDRKLLLDTEHGLKTTYGKMSTVERYLGPDFFRCMSGCIINMSKVKETKNMVVYFDNGKELKLGRTGYVHLKQKFNTYLREMIPWDDEEDGGNKKDSEPGGTRENGKREGAESGKNDNSESCKSEGDKSSKNGSTDTSDNDD